MRDNLVFSGIPEQADEDPELTRKNFIHFSRKLSPAECNYDVGNRELLAVKLALEDWRHWLEGLYSLSWFRPTIKIKYTSKMPRG